MNNFSKNWIVWILNNSNNNAIKMPLAPNPKFPYYINITNNWANVYHFKRKDLRELEKNFNVKDNWEFVSETNFTSNIKDPKKKLNFIAKANAYAEYYYHPKLSKPLQEKYKKFDNYWRESSKYSEFNKWKLERWTLSLNSPITPTETASTWDFSINIDGEKIKLTYKPLKKFKNEYWYEVTETGIYRDWKIKISTEIPMNIFLQNISKSWQVFGYQFKNWKKEDWASLWYVEWAFWNSIMNKSLLDYKLVGEEFWMLIFKTSVWKSENWINFTCFNKEYKQKYFSWMKDLKLEFCYWQTSVSPCFSFLNRNFAIVDLSWWSVWLLEASINHKGVHKGFHLWDEEQLVETFPLKVIGNKLKEIKNQEMTKKTYEEATKKKGFFNRLFWR